MKACLIDSYDSFVHIIFQYLEELDVETTVLRSNEASLEAIEKTDPDFLILGPGPGHPSESVYKGLIEAFIGKIPILGVCLGHQAISMYFGAQVEQADRLVHGKTSNIACDQMGVFHELPKVFEVTRYHSLIALETTVCDPLVVTARSQEDGYVMGVRHATLPIEGIQFHPESIRTQHGKEMFSNFVQYYVSGGMHEKLCQRGYA